MEKKAAEMHSPNAVAILHTVSSLFIWKAHELETHERVFYFPVGNL